VAHRLFENFLDDPEEYRACELYWRELTEHISNSIGQPAWRRWIPLYYADGTTPIEDPGNPIYDGRSTELSRGYRIIQWAPEADDQPHSETVLAAWLNDHGEYGSEVPRHELFINLVLSEDSARVAEQLLRNWMMPETSPDEMRSFLAQHPQVASD
jgi:hypothetical protein